MLQLYVQFSTSLSSHCCVHGLLKFKQKKNQTNKKHLIRVLLEIAIPVFCHHKCPGNLEMSVHLLVLLPHEWLEMVHLPLRNLPTGLNFSHSAVLWCVGYNNHPLYLAI